MGLKDCAAAVDAVIFCGGPGACSTRALGLEGRATNMDSTSRWESANLASSSRRLLKLDCLVGARNRYD